MTPAQWAQWQGWSRVTGAEATHRAATLVQLPSQLPLAPHAGVPAVQPSLSEHVLKRAQLPALV